MKKRLNALREKGEGWTDEDFEVFDDKEAWIYGLKEPIGIVGVVEVLRKSQRINRQIKGAFVGYLFLGGRLFSASYFHD